MRIQTITQNQFNTKLVVYQELLLNDYRQCLITKVSASAYHYGYLVAGLENGLLSDSDCAQLSNEFNKKMNMEVLY